MMKLTRNQRGFTIIELMIATTALSVLLLMVSTVMVGIGKLYYKGVNQTRLQDNVRSITDTLAQDLQLESNSVLITDAHPATYHSVKDPGTDYTITAICTGNVRYSYVTGIKLGDDSADQAGIRHVLWRDTNADADCSHLDLTADNPGSSGGEMLNANTRLTEFAVTETNNLFNISVGAAFGDDETINQSGALSTCNSGPGSDFCAVAHNNASVVQRLRGAEH